MSSLRSRRIFAELFTLTIAVLALIPCRSEALVAFPGAQGVGANATGGARVSGHTPTVYHVTNLNDSGAGSFRDAVSAGYRIVVFDVAGYITLKSAVSCASNITIAGETAPGGGIAINGAEVSFSNCNNVICRHLRFRQSTLDPNTGKSAVGMDSATNIIMDHVSVEFGQWDNIDANSGTNLTFQNIIDADPIGQQFNAHADSDATWYSNLWSSAHNRNPLAKGNIEYVNNVLYNFQAGFTAHTSGTFSMDIVKNYFIAGPSGSPGTPFFQIGGSVSIYGSGNYFDSNKDGALNASAISVPTSLPLSSPWNPAVTNSLPMLSAVDSYAYVVSTAGALPWNRDQVDAQVIGEVTSLGTKGRMWTSQTQTGLANGGFGTIASGTAYPDNDSDGLPDFWEAAETNGASTTSLSPTGTAASGYLNIEDYLHFMAAPHAITVKNTMVAVDLTTFTAGFSSPVFTLLNPSGGTVALAADGHTAQFTPTNNFLGIGSFQFSLPYPDGATATFTVSVCVSSVAIPPPPPPPTNVSWLGNSGTNIWDVNDAGNTDWTGGRTYFVNGDNATLDDTSAYHSVNLSGTVSPGSIEVNTNGSYTLGGTGLLGGTGALSKDGSGTLTISNSAANSFTGGVALNAGTLVVNQSVGSSGITLGDGTTLNVASAFVIGSNTLTVNGTSTVTGVSGSNLGPITGDGTLVFSANTRFDLHGDISTFTGLLSLGNSAAALRLYGALGSAGADFDLGTGSGSLFPRNGNVTIPLGSLSGGASTTLLGASSDANPVTYSIGGTNVDSTFSGQINNSGGTVSVTKVGGGMLTLTGTSNYTGATNVSAGTLAVNGVLGNTAVTVASGAALVGSGTIGGSVNVAAGGLLALNSGAVSTLTIANGLTLTGQTLAFDLSSSASTGNDQIKLTGGALNLSGTITIVPNLVNGALGAGTYNLITGGTSTTGSPTIKLLLPPTTRQSISTSIAGGSLQLVVSGSAANLNWVGAQGGLWDLNTTANWAIAPSAGAATDKFFNLDIVNFGDSSGNGSVTLTGTVQPAILSVANTTTNYAFGGTGNIAGPGSLNKSGNGALSFTAPAVANLSSTTVSGSTTVTVATAGLTVGETVVGSGIPLWTTISAIGSGTITLSQAATASATVSLAYYNGNTFTGGTTVSGGAVFLGNYNGLMVTDLGAGPVTLNGGALTMAGYTGSASSSFGTLYNNIVVPAGATGTLNVTQRSGNGAPYGAVFGTLTGGGTLNLGVNYVRGGIAGDWSAFTGTINVTTPGAGGNFYLSTNYYNAGMPLAAVNLGNNVTMLFAGILSQGDGTTVPIGELSGTTSATLMGGPSSSGGREFAWVIGARNNDSNRNVVFAGSILEQASGTTLTSLFKTGQGIWTLTGTNNSINGRVNVQQGTLALSGSLTSGDAIEIQDGASFNLSGGTVTADSLTVDIGGALTGCGTINSTVSNNGTVAFNCGGATVVNGDFQNSGTMSISNGSTLMPKGNFTNNGALTVASGSALYAAGATSFVNNGVLDLLTSSASALPANFVNNGTVLDSSLVRFSSFSKAGGTITLSVQTYPGHTYQLQSKAALSDVTWNAVTTNVSSQTNGSGLLTFTVTGAGGTSQFYRVQVGP